MVSTAEEEIETTRTAAVTVVAAGVVVPVAMLPRWGHHQFRR